MKEFEASFSDGSKDPQMCFNLAMLELSRDGRSKVAFDALQRALEVKPEYAEARIQLGLARLNAEQYGAALNTLSALKHVEPDKAATVFNALAFSCLKMGALEEARKNALQAQKWDRTDAETQQTREILSYLDTMERQTKARIEHPVAVSGERPAAPTRLESETSVPLYVPETIDLIEGTAKNIDCAKKRFVIDAGGKSMAFDMSDTARISVHHAGAGATFDFTCGAQKPFHVTVGYIAGAAKDVVGVLRSLQF
jgi:tetratricopeptide (TPR) repeat protein